MSDEQNVLELVKWQKRVFWTKIILYGLILIALIYVGAKAGGDPCKRCRLKAPALGLGMRN